MEMSEKQEKKLTNLIAENRKAVFKIKDRLNGLIIEYLREPQTSKETANVASADRPVSDDRITNLMNYLDDTNKLIDEGLGKPIVEIRRRLSRL